MLCGKSKDQKFRKLVATQYEKQLDIRSFIAVNTNLTLLISLLLSKQQLLLFKHHHSRAIPASSESSQEEIGGQKKNGKLPNLGLKPFKNTEESKQELISQLTNYPLQTRLDAELIQGIFGPSRASRARHFAQDSLAQL